MSAQHLGGRVTGTLIWYYYICAREVWLMARELNPDEDNVFLELGRFLSEESYSREKKEIAIGNLKVDLLKRVGKKLVVGEVKKSSRFLKSATMQLAFYLYRLKQQGLEAEGELLIPKEKKRVPVVLSQDMERGLEKAINEISQIISRDESPRPTKIKFCPGCAYSEFCWA